MIIPSEWSMISLLSSVLLVSATPAMNLINTKQQADSELYSPDSDGAKWQTRHHRCSYYVLIAGRDSGMWV